MTNPSKCGMEFEDRLDVRVTCMRLQDFANVSVFSGFNEATCLWLMALAE